MRTTTVHEGHCEDTCKYGEEDCPVAAEFEKKKRQTEAMHFAALVFGYNELAKRAQTTGERVYFRLFRGEYEKKLKEYADTGWVIEFSEDRGEDAPDKES